MDFERARWKAMWNMVVATVRLRPGYLISLAEAKRGRAFAGQAQGGVQQVSLNLIVGSVNRLHEFDRDFNPLTKGDRRNKLTGNPPVLASYR